MRAYVYDPKRFLPDAAWVRADAIRQLEHTMKNVTAKIVNDKLVIEIDVSKAALDAAEASKSGKTHIVATTGGFTGYGPVKLSLNCTR